MREAALAALTEDIAATHVPLSMFIAAATTVRPQITPDMLAFYERFAGGGKRK